jgi:hypothetical protein
MVIAGTVAGFALQLSVTERGVRIIRGGMLRAEHGQDCLIVVALKTRISAFLAVSLRRYGSGCGDGQEGHRQYRGSSNDHLGQHLHLSSLVELEFANTVHDSCIS